MFSFLFVCLGTLSLHTVVVNSKLDVRKKKPLFIWKHYKAENFNQMIFVKYLFVHTCLLFSQQIVKKAPSEMISMNCGPIVYLVNNVVSRMV